MQRSSDHLRFRSLSVCVLCMSAGVEPVVGVSLSQGVAGTICVEVDSTAPVARDAVLSLPKGLHWRKQCPVGLDLLQRTSDPNRDFCKQCSKDVYLSKTVAELRANVALGRCVAFSEALLEGAKHYRVFRGEMA
jgi:hypothetical protein